MLRAALCLSTYKKKKKKTEENKKKAEYDSLEPLADALSLRVK
jgi:hypothetical protein